MQDYVRRILTSAVYEVAEETSLEPMARLSARLGMAVLIKREDLQPVFSFKIRGAYNASRALTAAERARGVICASAGNHAQGVALSASALGIRAVDRHADDDAAASRSTPSAVSVAKSCSTAKGSTPHAAMRVETGRAATA